MPVSTPVNSDVLELYLVMHPDRVFVNYLIHGLRNGFHTKVSKVDLPTKECKNLLSARQQPNVVDSIIESEVRKGFLQGPYTNSPFSFYRVSPIGIAEGRYSGKQRLIVDLSAPHNDPEHDSINSLIDKNECSMSYVRIDDAIKYIVLYGKGTQMCKFDISDAFKLIPISPEEWHLFCIKWRGFLYYYSRLSFGCSSSCKIFDTLSQAVCWIAEQIHNIHKILHLLDDFLTLDLPDCHAEHTMESMLLLFSRLNIPLAEHKIVGPTTVLEFLGIILDSNLMQARLPQNKLDRIIAFICSILRKKSCTKRELLQLLGHFNFASRVILPGRSFVSYLISLSTTVSELHHYVHLTKECKEDLWMWQRFLSQWNGLSLFHELQLTNSADIELYTDAASTVGHGGYFQGYWFCETWPLDLPIGQDENSMAFRELYPIVVSAILWGAQWTTKRILFHCDNQATVAIINKGRSRSTVLMRLMRRLTWCSAKHNFVVYAQFVPSAMNLISDALSRQQLSKFRRLAPQAQPEPTPCPAASEIMWDFSKL